MKELWIKWYMSFLSFVSYSVSAFFSFVVQSFWVLVYILAWGVVFHFSGGINGWDLDDLVLFFSIVYLSDFLCFGWLPGTIPRGNLDLLFLKPKNLTLMYITNIDERDSFHRISYLVVGLVFFLTSHHPVLLKLFALCVAVIVFVSFKLLLSGIGLYFRAISHEFYEESFFLFDLAKEYPNKRFPRGLSFVFTFVIPGFMVSLIPIDAVKNPGLFPWVLGFAVAYFFVSYMVWNKGLERYQGIS